MSLTVIYRGKNIKFSAGFKKHQWLPLMILSVGAIAWSVCNNMAVDEQRASVEDVLKNAQLEYRSQKDNIALLKDTTHTQLAALQLKIGELQGQVNRLNAYGEELAKVAKIPETEFDFSQPPAIGGGSDETVTDLVVTGVSGLMGQMDVLFSQLDGQEQKMALLESILLNHNIEDGIYLSGRPVKSGWLSSYYGTRKDPFTGNPAHHKGIDFAGKQGAQVIATGAGIISWAGELYGYGQLIEIDHGNGFKTRYGHNEKILVEVGEVVDKGQHIARMGSSGRSTGPHVHYEIIKRGKPINPLKYVYRQTR
ncbi:MAG: murein DD-endopeptidase MepM/ murein hydrolase activator NlpD [Phenylobacterium sp.]|jgi:murein DD-endopeptidase MepM/ murein hydrolase activator NlpD